MLFINNQIIHSFVFMFEEDEHGKVSGFLVSSDRAKQSFLYKVTIRQYSEFARKLGQDYPAYSHQFTDPVTGEKNIRLG